MYREVDIKEAVMAALEGKTVFGINEASPEDTYNLTKQIEDLVKDGDRFIIDELTDEQIIFEQKMDELADKYNSMPDKPKTKAKKKPGPKKVDDGKIMALYQADWSYAKIADEMGISESTVRNHIYDMLGIDHG